MIGAKLSDQRNSRNAGRFKPTNPRLASHGFPAGSQKTAESQALIGRFETACIPLVAEFGTDHIEKAIFVTSASIFSETVLKINFPFTKREGKQRKCHFRLRSTSGPRFDPHDTHSLRHMTQRMS